METKKKSAQKSEVAGTLRELFLGSLKDIYYAENALVKTLPVMFEQATNQKLKPSKAKNTISTKIKIFFIYRKIQETTATQSGNRLLSH